MPAKKKSTPDRVKQFKDKTNNWWVGFRHYTLIDGEVMLCAGGMEDEEARTKIEKYLKGKKLIKK